MNAYGKAIERADRRRRIDTLLLLRAAQYDPKSFKQFFKDLTDGQ